jgi:hypothetical protein
MLFWELLNLDARLVSSDFQLFLHITRVLNLSPSLYLLVGHRLFAYNMSIVGDHHMPQRGCTSSRKLSHVG